MRSKRLINILLSKLTALEGRAKFLREDMEKLTQSDKAEQK